MFSRAGLRFFASGRQSVARPSSLRNAFFKRQQTTASNPAAAAEAAPQSVFQRLWTSEVGIKTVHFWCVYLRAFLFLWGVWACGIVDRGLPGGSCAEVTDPPKPTDKSERIYIHAHARGRAQNSEGHHLLTDKRAPIMKWGVVLAGATDFLRPAEKLSLTQNLALVATGSIWTRWCFVIRPANMLYVLLFLSHIHTCSRHTSSTLLDFLCRSQSTPRYLYRRFARSHVYHSSH